jgi:two-component sensor histidine kinase
MAAWDCALEAGGIDVECRIGRSDGTYLWFTTRATPVRDEHGTVMEWLGTSTDIDELRRLQEEQKVLVAELQHRTRNLIAVVRSIAQQTMAVTGPTPEFQEQFADRMAALARVQGLLSRSDEDPVTIEALIRLELDALGGVQEARDRIVLEGPPVPIRHSVVQTLALALHELATNARKYGALATDEGRLAVTWRVLEAHGEGRRLELLWTEDKVTCQVDSRSTQLGYGRELIERALPYALGAKTRFELRSDGVRCKIDLPLEKKQRGITP